MNYKSFLTDTWTKFSQLFSKFVKKTFVGTRAEWDLLSTAEKKQYDLADFTDDTASGVPIISDTVTAGDMNAVTSNAVASAIGKFTDLGSFGTLKAAGAKIYTEAIANISAGSSGLYCVNVTGIGYLFGRVFRVSTEAHGVFTVQENGNAIKRIYSWSRWSTTYSAQYWGYVELTDA